MSARYNEKGGRYFSRSEVLKATLTFGVLFRVPPPVVPFERRSFRTGSLQTGVAHPAAQHGSS